MSESKGVKEQLWDPVAGFGVTFRTMFKKVVTEQYPFEKLPHGARASTAGTSSTAGPTGWRSASAASCAPGPARPTRSTSRAARTPRADGERFSPGERYGRVYQINYLRCILCGLCIEACPTRALTMTNEYELADNNRADLIYEKTDLLAPLLPGMEQPPHPMRLGDDEGDYYRGTYGAPAPTEGGARVTFWILAPIMVAAALGILFVRKAVHTAMLLAVVMISLAVLYAVLDAPFLFAVQIIVYTGAILMLFLFVLMLVGVDASDSVVETIRGQRVLAVVLGLVFGSVLVVALSQVTLGTAVGLDEANAGGNVEGIANILFTKYVFAFEATSALLITAALGAMVLAHRERLTPKPDAGATGRPADARLRRVRQAPRPAALPGVYARHNAVDTPALLPDGTASEPRSSGCSPPAARSARPPRWPTTSRRYAAADQHGPIRRSHGPPGPPGRPAPRPTPRRTRSDPVRRPLGDPLHDRLRRVCSPAATPSWSSCASSSCSTPATSRSWRSPASTATSTARSPPSS